MMRGRNIWLVPLSIALVVAGVGSWASWRLSRAIKRELRENLLANLEANVTALEIWMANQKRIASSLADEPRVRTLSLELVEHTGASSSDRDALVKLSRELTDKERLQERLRTLGYGMAQIVNTNLVVMADTSRFRGRVGTTVLEELQPRYAELFESGEPIVITPFKVQRGGRRFQEGERRPRPRPNRDGPPDRPPPQAERQLRSGRDLTVMQVAAPIKDAEGITRAALALIINPNAEFSRILSVARSGDSGETIAFDATGLLISESRFDEDLRRVGLLGEETNAVSALTLRLTDPGGDLTKGFALSTNLDLSPILMVTRAVEGSGSEAAEVEVEPFRDYRGVPVVGAWRWLPEYGFGVGTKIDAREAYLPLRVVRGIFLILFVLLILAALVIFLFSYSHVVWRRRLTEAELKARQLGQYKLLEKIGEGGMGIVYKAHHALLRRETALKLLPPGRTDQGSILLFEREVQLTCRLTHPNTIQVFDYGRTPDGIFYYAMEYLDGLNLSDLVQQYGPQAEERVIHILTHICESLREAHALGLIHRDIKPANVFLCDRGGVPDSVKVLDFGLVKHFGEMESGEAKVEILPHEGIVGTPNFLAPESIKDPTASDARSDLYSLGALGFYLLTGSYVFEGESVTEICRKHITEQPASPGTRTVNPISAELDAIIMDCLAKEPDSRPQSAGDLAARLRTCSLADAWTTERRITWWNDHRAAIAAKAAQPPPTVISEATVNIALSDRVV